MPKFVVLAGGLGNQLFQIAGALSATDEVVHAITCVGNPKQHEGRLEISALDFQGRVQFKKCTKRHFVTPLAFRAMLSLATTRQELLRKKPYRMALLLLAAMIFSVHFRIMIYPRISKGVGFDPDFTKKSGNLFIGYFQSYQISYLVRELMIEALNQFSSKHNIPTSESSETLIHIRLGDYKREAGFGVVNSGYISTALNLLEMRVSINQISIFSDEPEKALDLIPSSYSERVNVKEVVEESPLLTLCRMRGYENYILANSTFSWWAAYTSDPKNVLVPDPWFVAGESPVELVPESWVRIKRA